MSDDIIRLEWEKDGPRKGTWIWHLPGDGRSSAAFCCPRCDRIQSLISYEILPNGVVKQRVRCAAGGCGWDGILMLAGWS